MGIPAMTGDYKGRGGGMRALRCHHWAAFSGPNQRKDGKGEVQDLQGPCLQEGEMRNQNSREISGLAWA